MRCSYQVLTSGVLLCLSAGAALARSPLAIPTDQPKDFPAVQADLKSIDNYIGKAQCGGFNMNESVIGKISAVTGVPGRTSLWNGSLLSGMGVREDKNQNKNIDDDYQFPDSTTGFTTACASNLTQIKKKVWQETKNPLRPGEIRQVDEIFPHPAFRDPSCTWRTSKIDPATGEKIILQTAPDIPLDPLKEYGKTPDKPVPMYDKMTESPDDQQSPKTCEGFCPYLNSWQYPDCETVVDSADGTYQICTAWIRKYLCTDQKAKLPKEEYAKACDPSPVDNGNSRLCNGQECRCSQWGAATGDAFTCKKNPSTEKEPGKPVTSAELGEAMAKTIDPVYYSYYRTYRGNATRDPVPSDGPPDNAVRTNVQVACYGFYEEFDPKFHQTKDRDRRCVINTDVSGMRESQTGKGDYGTTTKTEEIDPVDPATNQRQKTGAQKDIWYMKLGWGFSLLNEESFKTDYNRNLSDVFLDSDSLDNADLEASWQVDRIGEDPIMAKSNLLRSFDDTGTGRILVTWWQKQQTEVATLLHPPVVRILLPPGYSFGADPADPLFAAQNSSAAPADSPDAKRSRRIEVQLDASDDILGEALGVIERSFLLHLEEEPVPVLVPMGSPTEFRAKAQEWCIWHMRNTAEKNCDNAPEDIKKLMQKLETYAGDIERVRELRSELARYAGKVMQIQKDLTRPISDWMTVNLNLYKDYLKTQKDFAKDVTEKWRAAQEQMTEFQDVTNLPWCMNQRYETPVFSLLDSWLPSRAANSKGIEGDMLADGLPNITVPRPKDLIIDFSHIAYMTGSLKIPVLKPVQVRLDIPSPPAGDAPLPELPDLPSITGIQFQIRGAMAELPEVESKAVYPPLDLPAPDMTEINETKATIDAITLTLKDLNDRYGKFWESIGPLKKECEDASNCQSGEECIQNACIPAANTETNPAKRKQSAACLEWNDETCQHVEMDLMERFQRINSRKMITLREDYWSEGLIRLSPDACMPQDNTCQLLHRESTGPLYQWQINEPKPMPDLVTGAREAIRDATLLQPVGDIDPKYYPPYDTDINSLLPFYDVPPAVNLVPEE